MPEMRREERTAGRLLKVAAAAAVLALAAWHGAGRMIDAREELLSARQRYVEAQARAAALPGEDRRLAAAREAWAQAKKKLWRSAESGVMLKDLEDAAGQAGARLVRVEPGQPVEKFWRGHLRAVPVKLSLEGTYPQVLAAVAAVERLASPGEVRQFEIRAVEEAEVPGTVRADIEAVFYSLNPPEVRAGVPGNSGRYDPFLPLALPEEIREEPAPQETSGSEKGLVEARPPQEGPGGEEPVGRLAPPAGGAPAQGGSGEEVSAEGETR
ncbi:MAG: type 4a pilus biogenesis protein PilO [Moorellales bacterium]